MKSSNLTEPINLFVPGRLCLFGEHTDWTGRYTEINADVLPGKAIVTGIDLGIYATAEKSDTFELSSLDENGNAVTFSCNMDKDVLREEAKEPQFFCYACGVAAYLIENYRIGGAKIDINKVTLPIKKGLSSSAAICVLVARAFNELYYLKMSISGEMQAAYRGEMLTKSRCGRLDQACAYGVAPVCMEFDGNEVYAEKLSVGKNMYLVFADLMAKKDTKKILSDLNRAYPFPQTETDKKIHEALGKDNQRIISEAVDAIAKGDTAKVGSLMTEAQKMFDEKVAIGRPEELTSPVLHGVLNDPKVKELTLGGKGVGSQGDGTVQFICEDKLKQAELVKYLEEQGMEPHAFMLPAGDRVRKAIIPVAGFGTRMYPETRFVKKEFLPVIDQNGLAKPVIMYLLEELEEAGIEEIIIIVGEEELEGFKEMFSKGITEERIKKLPESVREYEKKIASIGRKLKFSVQKERRGFGHAVYQAREHLGKEPVLLMLGDFIYKSNINLNCATQLIKSYQKSGGKLTVGIKPVELENVVHYGILTGTFDDRRSYMMSVTEMYEKPTVRYAKDHLATKTPKGREYYCTFGTYVLTPDVFDYLEEDIKRHDETGDPSEIQLTSALCRVLEDKGMTGALIDGKSYDVGIPKAYGETILRYSEVK